MPRLTLPRFAVFAALALIGGTLFFASPQSASACALCDTYRVVGVAADDVLYMRARPSSKGRIVAAIPYDGIGIVKSGGCSGNWCRMSYGGKVGWVNMRYLRYVTG